MMYHRLSNVFPDLPNGGIFAHLNAYDMPWSQAMATDLDIDYLYNQSGDKIVSKLIASWLGDDGKLDDADVAIIARVIATRYRQRWTKLYATLEFEYNPISNYDMTEVMTDDTRVTEYGHTDTQTDNLSHRKTGTDTRTPNTIETRTPAITETQEHSVQGFNSTDYQPAGQTVTDETGTETTALTGTDTTQYNTTDTDTGTRGRVEGGSDTETRNYTLTRTGNIGVTTSQQMIESERDLWLWDFFKTVVYPDIDSIITIPIY